MKMIRVLLALALVCGFAGRAKADDFQMIVVDPTNSYTDVFTNPFTFTFSACDAQDPTLTGYVGCFVGKNLTGQVIHSLEIFVPNTIGSQTAGCALSGTGLDLFKDATCGSGPDGVGYELSFTNGTIGIGQFFTIAEAGADPEDFGTMTGTANTPEPGSLWLLSSGLLSSGYLLRRRRTGGPAQA
ncbi:MAG: PEP-CTERM sorting domain-containing protein [Acidobacteriota bacterium]|nr:PEP-CTERM sorting domain-containing protein [Acidobacteriota bacterium]